MKIAFLTLMQLVLFVVNTSRPSSSTALPLTDDKIPRAIEIIDDGAIVTITGEQMFIVPHSRLPPSLRSIGSFQRFLDMIEVIDETDGETFEESLAKITLPPVSASDDKLVALGETIRDDKRYDTVLGPSSDFQDLTPEQLEALLHDH